MLGQCFSSVIILHNSIILKNVHFTLLVLVDSCFPHILRASLNSIIRFIWIQHNMNNLVKTLNQYIWGKSYDIFYYMSFFYGVYHIWYVLLSKSNTIKMSLFFFTYQNKPYK